MSESMQEPNPWPQDLRDGLEQAAYPHQQYSAKGMIGCATVSAAINLKRIADALEVIAQPGCDGWQIKDIAGILARGP